MCQKFMESMIFIDCECYENKWENLNKNKQFSNLQERKNLKKSINFDQKKKNQNT